VKSPDAKTGQTACQPGLSSNVTFQHLKYYPTMPIRFLKSDFEALAEAGAGHRQWESRRTSLMRLNLTMAHFYIMGWGTSFFDQIVEGDPTRQAFIDRHVIYNGKYINTELISIWFVDLARAG